MKYLLLLLIISCSHKITKDGGQAPYEPSVYEALGPEDMTTYAQSVVMREVRDPEGLTLENMRDHKAGEIRHVGLVVFETQIQPSRSGLASDRNVYLSARGKQILTEQLWSAWDRELRRLSGEGVTWVPRRRLLASKAYRSAGSMMPDYVLKRRDTIGEGDILWRKFGQKIPEESLLQPRSFQDMGLLLIPANELMGGAKPSQHHHHWVNDLAKELGLDAVVVVFIGAEWRRGGVDKRTKAKIDEVMTSKVEATVLYPWGRYHQVGESLGRRNLPKVNVPLGFYQVKDTRPVVITVPEADENFKTAQTNVIEPLQKTLLRLSSLVQERISSDIRQTHKTGN